MRVTLYLWLIALFLAFGVVSADEHQKEHAADEHTQEQSADPAQAGESAEEAARSEAQLGGDLIAALQADPNFSIFAEALIQSQVFDRLEAEGESGPFTILAPTNDAFHAIGLQSGQVEQGGFDYTAADPAELYELVRNHIISGSVSIDDLEAGGELVALSGSRLAVQSAEDETVTAESEEGEESEVAGGGQAGEAEPPPRLMIDGARIVHRAAETPGGLIYGINTVFLPEGVDLELEEAAQPDEEEPGGAADGGGDEPAQDEAGGQD